MKLSRAVSNDGNFYLSHFFQKWKKIHESFRFILSFPKFFKIFCPVFIEVFPIIRKCDVGIPSPTTRMDI